MRGRLRNNLLRTAAACGCYPSSIDALGPTRIAMAAKLSLTALLGVLLGACSVAPVPVHLARPADPVARVPAVAYQSVTAGVTTMRPAEPKNWRELNRRVGPQQ